MGIIIRRSLLSLLLVLSSIFVHAQKSEADFWAAAPEEVRSRYNDAADNFLDEWVLDFADSLETMAKSTGKIEYRMYASELRCHNFFNKKDSLMFMKHSEDVRFLSKRHKYYTLYFAELTNVVSFYANTFNPKEAESAAKELISEAKALRYMDGLYYGYFVLGALEAQKGDLVHSTQNYLKGLDYVEGDGEAQLISRAQTYCLVASNYLSSKDYDNAEKYALLSREANPLEDDVDAVLGLVSFFKGDYHAFREYANKYIENTDNTSISFEYYSSWLQALLCALDKDYDRAFELAELFEESADKYDIQTEIYKLKGDWKSAFEAAKISVIITNTNLGEMYSNQIDQKESDLEQFYQDTAKENKILHLSYALIIILLFVAGLVVFIIHRDRELKRERRYRSFIENAPIGFSQGKLIFNPDGTVKDYYTVQVNSTLDGSVKRAGAKIGEKTILEAYPVSGPVIIGKINEALAASQPHIRFSFHLEEFDVFYETIILFDVPGYVRIISLNTTDLEKMKARAERADKLKTQFVQNMSHEIRTPLNAIVGFSQLLGLPAGSITEEEKEKYTEYISNNSDMLMMLIDDILDVADAERGDYQINIAPMSCNEVCRAAISTVEYKTPTGVEMRFETDAQDDFIIQSDARRIQQVLINYLTNACKHTKQGEIVVGCSLTANPGKVTFSVTDTGCGVPAEMAENIFERFTKLDIFVQGAGLGLNICSTIAGKLGATVKLDTTYTNGARFLLII